VPESDAEKTSKRSISMPVSLWAFLENEAAKTTQKNLSKMLQLLVEREQRDRSPRYTWRDYSVHLVEEPGTDYQATLAREMDNHGITQPPSAASISGPGAPGKSAPTPPAGKHAEGR
jgi:hypothetical protein